MDATAPLADANVTPGDAPVFATGKYALLARFYGLSSTSGGGWFSEESVALLDVQPVPGSMQLRMEWTTCAYRGQLVVPLFPPISYAVLSPQSFPKRSFDLTVSGNSFEASAQPALIGYEPVSGCAAGGTQSHPDRPWLVGGLCSCPSSDLPPTLPNDCRVTDVDGDRNPGFTVQFTGGTENFSYTRSRDGSQLVKGQLSADGHHSAQYLANMDTYQLACAREPCSRSSAQVCPAEKNPVRFLPLAGKDADCAAALSAVENSGSIGLGMPGEPDC